MKLKKILISLLAALTLTVYAISASAANTIEIGEEFTGYDSETVNIYDNELESEYALDMAYVVVSFDLVSFDEDGGFALKLMINDDGSSNDYYFLTLATNSWATVDSGYGVLNDPIEPTETGTYNLKFDVSSLGELTNIKLNLWQGTAKLNGVAFLDSDENAIFTDGTIAESTVGCFTPEDGQVDEFVISSVTTDATEEAATEETEVVTIAVDTDDSNDSSSIMSEKMPWLFNLLSADILGLRVVWILVGFFFLLGIILIIAAISINKKKKRAAKKAAKNKRFKEKYKDR